MAGKVVAYLEVVLHGQDPNETQSDIEIRGSEQFHLGRSEAACRQSWPDPVISNKHLQIHCVLYEQDPSAEIPPLVYATDVSTNGTYLKKARSLCASSHHYGVRMGRNATFLLDDGDALRLSDSVTLVYRSVDQVTKAPLTAIQDQEKQHFSSKYLITGRVLGVGGFGKVMVAVHRRTQRQVACKIIDLQKQWSALPPSDKIHHHGRYGQSNECDKAAVRPRWPSQMTKRFREFDILSDLSHPNIIAIEKVFWSSNTIYIFQDLVAGGDLFSFLEKKGGRLPEIEAAVIIRQVLIGVQYLHGRNIVHRDLKPDNILMSSFDDGARIVITDFGNARYLSTDRGQGQKAQRMFSCAGTLEYAAPEIHQKNVTIPPEHGYTKSVDMWSIGAITGILLSGDVIFFNDNRPSEQAYYQTYFARISRCDLSFLDDKNHRIWRNTGSKPKHFIKSLLTLYEEHRLTATEALAHPWFSNPCHAATFKVLYEKSTRDWQPRTRISQMVEPISGISAHVPRCRVSEEVFTLDVISRHFPPPPRQTSSMPQKANVQRGYTRLPSIKEELELESARRESKSELSQSQQSSYPHRGSIGNSMEQPPLDPTEQQGRYSAHTREYVCPRLDDHYMSTSVFDSVYDFSIPQLPPKTPEGEVEEVYSYHVVPETPIKQGTKRPRDQLVTNSTQSDPDETGGGDGDDEEDKLVHRHGIDENHPAYYAQMLLKRRRIPS